MWHQSTSIHTTLIWRLYALMNTLLFGSSNKGKVAEVSKVAGALGVTIVGLDSCSGPELGAPPVVVEGLPTYEANAAHKALSYARWARRPCLGDDTGLELDVLGGLPGLYSHRFGLPRVAALLGLSAQTAARFVCCISYAEPSGRLVSVTRALEGRLRRPSESEISELADDPLPYARLFTPVGETRPLRELLSRDGFLSHRGMALSGLLRVLFG